MNWIYALLLGMVQALTEFLPVSSSGHLVVFQKFLKVPEASQASTRFSTWAPPCHGCVLSPTDRGDSSGKLEMDP